MTTARIIDAALEATVVLSYTRIGSAVRRRVFDWRPPPSMAGRTALVTGANSGLGYAAAERIAGLGAAVHLVVRSPEKGSATRRRLIAATGNAAVTFAVADLTDLDAARAVAEAYLADRPTLDVLINNAGAMFATRRDGPQGIEATAALHVAAPHVLTRTLLPALRASAGPGRVITVTSGGMYTQALVVDRLFDPGADYRGATQYARAKRAQVVMSERWAEEVDPREVVFHAMHPGWAATTGVSESLPRFHRIMGPLLRDPDDGADTMVWLAAADEATRTSGDLWLDRRRRSTHRSPTTAEPDGARTRLWQRLEALAG